MATMTGPVRVCRAQPEDRDQVLSFCMRTWEWGDYIGDVWDEWVRGDTGPLLVAVVGDQVAGTGKVTMLSRAEAWLEGLRVNPAFRGHGVAQALYDAAETEARKRWARVARYATPSTNVAIHNLSERFGYRRVARLVEYAAPAEAGELPHLLALADADAAESQLALVTKGLAASGGLYHGGWHCRELRGGRLREHIVNGEAYGVRQGGWPVALALVSEHDSHHGLRVGFLGGNSPAVAELARQLRALAHHEGSERVMVVIPVLPILQDALRSAGYERAWEHEMWIYERQLRG